VIEVPSINIANIQNENTKNTIIITGAPRSGTSLLGKLISTLGGIEYHFEPPMVWVLSALMSMKVLSPEIASYLLRLYLHEDLFIESAHGRKVNLRPQDDSLVLNSIHWGELLSRWQHIKNREDAINYIAAKKLRLALKVPSVIDAIPFYAEAMPESQFIIIKRNGGDVVRSIVKKGWLSDEGLNENYWPYKIIDGHKVPHLVEDAVAAKWAQWNAPTRACYLWRRDAEFALQVQGRGLGERLHIISYEDLRRNPKQAMGEVAQFLSTEITDLTELGIRSVRPFGSVSGVDDIFIDVEPDELRKFREINATWGCS